MKVRVNRRMRAVAAGAVALLVTMGLPQLAQAAQAHPGASGAHATAAAPAQRAAPAQTASGRTWAGASVG
jgi:hypothetical protein